MVLFVFVGFVIVFTDVAVAYTNYSYLQGNIVY